MANCKVFQCYYEPEQISKIYNHKWVVPVYNPVPEKFNFNDGYFTLENKIILDKITTDIKEDYVGVWSHKHHEKIWGVSEDGTYNKRDGLQAFLNWFEQRVKKGNFDVMGFHRRMNKHHRLHMLTRADQFHPGFTRILKHMVSKGKLPVNMRPPFNYVTLMNYQIARTDIYLDYIEKVLKPAIKLMMDQSDVQLQSYLFSDSGYNGDAKHNGTLQRISGTNYYTLHTFVLERLFTLYLNTRNYKCINY